MTVAGVVAGSNNLIKSGDGTLVLSGVNTYSGNTTISSGTLNVSGQLGSGTYSSNIINNGILQYSSSSNQTLSGVVSGSGSLLKDGSGELILSGTNTYVGSTTLSAGSIRISADSGLGSAPGSATSDHLILSNGGILKTTATFTLNSNRGVTLASGTGYFKPSSSTELTYGGIIAGSGNLKSSHGTLILNGSNTFTGTTLVRSGTLIIRADSGLGTAPGSATADHLMINGGELKTTTTFTLNSNRGILLGTHDGFINVDSGTTLTYGGIIDGTSVGDLIKNGSGILTLSGINTYTASTTINAGTISISADSGLGAAPGSPSAGHLTLNGGTLEATTANFTLNSNRGIALGASNGIIDVNSGVTLTYGGIMAGSGTLTKVDSGTLTLSGVNTYSGSTTINGGTVSISADSGLGSAPGSASAGHLTLNGGTLEATADFTLNSNRGIALGASNGIIDVNSGTTLTYGGIMAGSGTLT
jgi:autotransporter-associated beta strand protein